MTTAVYVHFPFCERKCPYCDFASIRIGREDVPHREYADAVIAELERRAPDFAGRTLGSVFLGGGTPSLWAAPEVGRVLAAIRAAFVDEVDALEVTAECNPVSLDAAKAAAFVDAGVNRLSIGAQSLDDLTLRRLGRLHDGPGALAAVTAALSSGVRVSADLIFGVPEQSLERVCEDASRLIGAGVEHLSAYALTIEPGTQFGELHRLGKLEVTSDEGYAETFAALESHLEGLGLGHYEVSNYARAGAEARHNSSYWRLDPYVGLGAGAVGCLDRGPGLRRRWRNHPSPDRYQALAKSALPEESEETLGPQEIVREGLMLGLRTREGVDLARLASSADVDPLDGRDKALRRRIEQGDLERRGDLLRVPRDRWLFLDGIVSDLF